MVVRWCGLPGVPSVLSVARCGTLRGCPKPARHRRDPRPPSPRPPGGSGGCGEPAAPPPGGHLADPRPAPYLGGVSPLCRPLHRVQALLHALCGWVLFRAGCRLRARRHYERVLQLRGDDFTAYVHLGRIAFAIGDYSGWRREFEHARRTDPVRFARLRHPTELFEPRFAGTDFERGTGSSGSTPADGEDRATWRSLLFGPARQGAGQRADAGDAEGGDAAGIDGGLDALLAGAGTDRPDASRPGAAADDCSTSAERRRFAELGPIGAREVRQCDLDELARRLSG